MPRQFKIVGTINDDTKILGSTYGEVKKVIEAGFQEQFILQKASQEARSIYAQATAQAEVGKFIVDKSAVKIHNKRIADFVSHGTAIAGGASRMSRVRRITEIVNAGIVDRIVSSSVPSVTYQNALSTTFVEKVVKEQLEAGMSLNVRLSNGLLVMTTGNEKAPASLKKIFNRRRKIVVDE